jgi:uncharacterized damage-inducible protein DinB
MRVGDLERLFEYNYWANRKVFEVVARLTPEQFTQSVAGSYGSIRNTLVHVLSAEWGWLDRCGGPPRGERLNPEDYPTATSLMQAWAPVEANMRTFLAGLADDDLQRTIEFSLSAGPIRSASLEQLLQHAAAHAMHHRGQVSLLLRALGYVPGNFDMIIFDSVA